MGSTPSVNLPINNNGNFNYFAIQFSRSDRLRIILAPEIIHDITREVFKSNWIYQEENVQPGFVEFKLFGSPWNQQEVDSKPILCKLLTKYYENGWHLNASTDLQRIGSDTDVLFFHKTNPLNTTVICLSLNSTDLVRIFSEVNIYSIIKSSVIRAWAKGVQSEEINDKFCELKLNGNPWNHSIFDDSDSFNAPFFILELIKNLFVHGWTFIGAINSVKKDKPINSLYFRHEKMTKFEAEETKFFAMSLDSSDKIRFYKMNKDLKSLISNDELGLASLWTDGIQFEGKIENVLEFKLKGNPWNSNGDDAVKSRALINNLINLFDRHGWSLYATCVLTKKTNNTSKFFFKKTNSLMPSKKLNMCLSFNSFNIIRLIGSEDNLIDEVKDGIVKCWPKGFNSESDFFGSKQINLNGSPFSCHGAQKIYSCALIVFILNNLDKRGYKLLCSADVSKKFHRDRYTEFSIDLHSLFFEKTYC